MAIAVGVAARVFLRIEPAVGSDLASAAKTCDRLDRVNEDQSRERTDARLGAQAHHARVALGASFQLLLQSPDLLIELSEQRQGVLSLESIGAKQGEPFELVEPCRGEQPWSELQLVIQGHRL